MTAGTTRAARVTEEWKKWSHTRALLCFDSRAGGTGALSDLAVSVKDVYPVAGMPARAGSLAVDGGPAPVDTPVVAALRQAGATIAAKSNCSEFGIGVTATETRLAGRVTHPFDGSLSPGGSSGGDAVAVATGTVDLAVASDYGGSVRWPAQALGVCGLRTTAGLLPRDGRIPAPDPGSLQDQLEVVGIMARTPATLSRVLPHLGIAASAAVSGRLAVTTAAEIAPVGGDVAEAVRSVAQVAIAAGFEVVDPGPLFDCAATAYAFLRAQLDHLDNLRQAVRGREDLLCPGTHAALQGAAGHPAAPADRIAAARRRAGSVRARLLRLLEAVDAVVMPVAAVTGTDAVARTGAEGAGPDGQWHDGQLLDGPTLMAFCRAVSLTGLPALSLPAVVGRAGRPVSVQIVGRPGADLDCCRIAETLGAGLGLPEPRSLPWGRRP